jgi:hypothetical protein
MTMLRPSISFALVVAVCAVSPGPAHAQPSGKWEVEVHGGGLWSTSPTAGKAETLPVATPFTTFVGTTSRRESSWLFGDGASLLNSVNAALRANGTITPLDSVIGAAAARRGNGGAVGFRVARRFGARYAAEFAFDSASAPLKFTSAAIVGIGTTHDSFVTAFKGLLATGPFSVSNVSATTDLKDSRGSQLITTGVLTVDLLTHGRFIPYVAGGAGVVNNRGDAPSATLTGTYAFSLSIPGLNVPFNETDRVIVRVAPRSRDAVGVFGGGLRYTVSPRWGIRADLRAHVGGGKVDTLVDATPTAVSQTPSLPIASGTSPSIQFSNNQSLAPTTLSGPAISGLRTFTASGTAIRTNITGGVYFRF